MTEEFDRLIKSHKASIKRRINLFLVDLIKNKAKIQKRRKSYFRKCKGK